MVKRFLEDKRVVLFLAVLGVASLTLLAGALNHIAFEPAKPLYREKNPQALNLALDEVTRVFLDTPLWQQAAFLMLIVLIVALIATLLSPEARKKLIKMIIRGALAVWIFGYLIQKNPDLLKLLRFPELNLDGGKQGLAPFEEIAPPVFEPPQVSDTLSFFIALGVVIVAAVVAWRVYLWWKRQQDLLNARSPLDDVAKIARASLRDLRLPGASHDAIIRCYENMSQAVYARHGLQRSYAMTAAEFAQRLENTGLPREPVKQLTRLFESARYSARASTQKEIDEAISCLTLILKHCGETP